MNPISVTIRPGKAAMLNLGSKDIAPVLSYLREFREHIIAKEIVDNNPDSIHLQIGLFDTKLAKNVRRRLLQLLAKAGWNEKQLKHGLHVKAHDDWFKLASYCSKQGNIVESCVTSLGSDFDMFVAMYHDNDMYDDILSQCLEHEKSSELDLHYVNNFDENKSKKKYDCSKHANIIRILEFFNEYIYK